MYYCKDNKNKLKNLPPELNTSIYSHVFNVSRINPEATNLNYEDISYSLKLEKYYVDFWYF